jgi:hypothetical protein
VIPESVALSYQAGCSIVMMVDYYYIQDRVNNARIGGGYPGILPAGGSLAMAFILVSRNFPRYCVLFVTSVAG